MDHSELISRLKFIGKIQKGDKINVKHMFVQPDSFVTKLSRTLFNIDDRTNTFIFLTSILSKSFDLLAAQLESNQDAVISSGGLLGSKGRPKGNQSGDHFYNILSINLVQDLHNSITGIKNLKQTYDEDKLFGCKMDVMLEEVEARLAEFESKYEFLKRNEEE